MDEVAKNILHRFAHSTYPLDVAEGGSHQNSVLCFFLRGQGTFRYHCRQQKEKTRPEEEFFTFFQASCSKSAAACCVLGRVLWNWTSAVEKFADNDLRHHPKTKNPREL